MILTTAMRNILADAIDDAVNGGGGAGYAQFETSGDVEVATLTFSATAFGAASGGTITANAITSDTSATGGVAAKLSLYDAADAKVLELSVGTSGADVTITNTTIPIGATVTMSALTVTVPAS
jgi:hypothetical protein